MGKRLRNILLITVAVIILAAIPVTAIFLFGGDGNQPTVLDPSGLYNPNYEEYRYPHSDAITIDGELDEDTWQNKKWYVNTTVNNVLGNLPKIWVTTEMDEYGVYIAAKSSDTNVMDSNETRTTWKFRAAAGNLKAGGDGRYFDFKVDSTGKLDTGSLVIERGIKVQGTMNSGATEGTTLEMFIPWQALDVDFEKDAPEMVKLHPGYTGYQFGSGTVFEITPVQAPLNNTLDYIQFDNSGYIHADREGAVVGDTFYDYGKNGGWDVSQEAEGIVRSSNGNEHHRIFFKDQYGPDFLVETNITFVGAINNDWPKAGISFMTSDFVYHTPLLEFHKSLYVDGANGPISVKDISIITLDEHDRKWNQKRVNLLPNDNVQTQKGFKLTALKNGGRLWYFVDDIYVGSEEATYMDTDVIPCLYTLGCDAIFENYSCKAVTDEETNAYLLERHVNPINVFAGAGGSVKASKISVVDGESYDLIIMCKSGYEVESILINGVECIDDAVKNSVDGVYTVTDVVGAQEVKVKFKQNADAKISGLITDAETGLDVTGSIDIYGISNPLLHYQVSASQPNGYQCQLPEGEYRVVIAIPGYQYFEATVTADEETTLDVALEPSIFTDSVHVNNGTADSQMQKWNLTKESQGYVTSSYAMKGTLSELFFNGKGTNFVAQTRVDYITNFVGGVDYQPDLMGGFVFDDGARQSWVVAHDTGLVKAGWRFEAGLIDYNALRHPTKLGVTLTVAKYGDDIYFYLNQLCVSHEKWSDFATKMDPEAEVAIGLYSVMDKPADIKYSDYSVSWDDEYAKEYIKTHPYGDISLGNSPFARALIVNGNRIVSFTTSKWDVSQVKNGVVRGSFGRETKLHPLYFNAKASDFAVEAYFEYEPEKGKCEQPDLMGGFGFSDGKSGGNFILACGNGICYTDWKRQNGLFDHQVLLNSSRTPIKFSVAKKGSDVYIYYNDIFAKKLSWSEVAPKINSNSNVAVSLMMLADKPATIKVSQYKIYTGVTATTEYISERAPKTVLIGNTPLARTVLLKGQSIVSALDKWDISHVDDGYVLGNFGLGTKFRPLYFGETATDFAVEAYYEYLPENGKYDQSDLFGGFGFTDGTSNTLDWVMANRDGVTYTDWGHIGGLYSPSVLLNDTRRPVKFAVAKIGSKATLYMNDVAVKTVDWETIAPNISADAKMAIALYMTNDKASTLKASQYKLHTGTAAATAYVANHAPKTELLGDTPLAKIALLNGKPMISALGNWDTSHIDEGYVLGSHGMKTMWNPLYFGETAKDFAVEAYFEYLPEDGKFEQKDLFGGFGFYDGTANSFDWLMANRDGVTHTNWGHIGGLNAPPVLQNDTKIPVKFAVAKIGSKATLYMNDIPVKTVEWKTIAPNISADSEIAVALFMFADKASTLKVGQYKMHAGTISATAYVANRAPKTELLGDSPLAKTVLLKGNPMISALGNWDTSHIDEGYVLGSHGMKTMWSPLYFGETAKDFAVEAYFEYLPEDGKYEQWDLFGGFGFYDGTGTGFDWLMVNRDGVTHTNWGHIGGLNNPPVLQNDTKLPVKFAVAKVGSKATLYMNDVAVKTVDWATIAPNISADSEIAIALFMYADKAATLKASQYKIHAGTIAATTYVANRTPKTEMLGDTPLAKTVLLKGNSMVSALGSWDISHIDEGYVLGSFGMGTKWKPLYFGETATDFAVEAYFEYLPEDGQYEQWDLFGGFGFNDGTSTDTDWVMANRDGITHSNWGHIGGLITPTVLQNNTRIPVKFAVVKIGSTAYISMNDILVKTVEWATIAPHISADSEMAIALFMTTDKAATLKASQYQIYAGTEKATQYKSELKLPEADPFEDSVLARTVTVNGVSLTSAADKWDISHLAEGYVLGSHALGTTWNPLYFKETASDFAVEAYYEYDPTGPSEQPDLFGGFEFKNGSKGGWIMAHDTGITYSGWKFENGLNGTAVLKSDTKIPVKFAIAKIGDTAYIYINDVLVKTVAWSTVVPDVPANSTMAIGLGMNTNKPSTLKVSQFNLYAGTQKATKYMDDLSATDADPYETSPFAKTVKVGDKTLTSAISKWDLSAWSDGYVLGSFGLGTKCRPLYFNGTATDFAVEAYFEYLPEDGKYEQSDLFGGFEFNDGTSSNWVMANRDGVTHTGWGHIGGLITPPVLQNDTKLPVKFAVVKVGAKAYLYFNDELKSTVDWSTVAPNIGESSEMAIALFMNTDKASTLKVSQYNVYAGTEMATKYMSDLAAPVEDPFEAAGLAKEIVVNDATLASGVEKWDVSHLGEGYVLGSHAMATRWNPLYFKQTASDFAVEAYFEYDATGPAEQPDLFGGFEFKDGSAGCWVMAHDTGIAYTGWKFENGLCANAVLKNNTKVPVKFAVVKIGDTAYIYMNDVLVRTIEWGTLAPFIPADATMAIGLGMNTDKPSTLKVSQFKMYAGTEMATKYMNDLVTADEDPYESSPFAKTVKVGDKTVSSAISKWDLSAWSEGYVLGSYGLGTKCRPLYFNGTATDFAVEAYFEYLPEDGKYEQWDLFGGFEFNNGTSSGWVMANRDGVTHTGWGHIGGLITPTVLQNDTKLPVKFAVVKIGAKAYLYFNDELKSTVDWSTLAPGISEDSEMAIALFMNTDKAATLKVSQYNVYAGTEKATAYATNHGTTP